MNQHGKPLDHEAVFAMLESLDLDFDKAGNFDNLSIVVPPMLLPRAKYVLEQINSDKELRNRYLEIIERKRSEWRDREADRKLVG